VAFIDIPGNKRVKNILRKSLARDRLPNSLLFSGPDGVGKKETASVIAKALNCLEKSTDACEICANCKDINKENFPDVRFIAPIRDVLKIDQMRLLKEAAYLRPMMGKKRIFIIIDADKMNNEAENSLLKVLEEPPLFSFIILLTNSPYDILPTIKSRCQNINFSAISGEDIKKSLIEKGMERDKAKILSLLARGNLNKALSLDEEEIQAQRKKAWLLFMSFLDKKNMAGLLKKYSNLPRKVVEEELGPLLEIISSFCRDLIVIKEGGDLCYLINQDYKTKMIDMEERIGLEQLLSYLNLLDDSFKGFEYNTNVRLIVSSLIVNFLS